MLRPRRKVIYRSELDNTKGGRAFRALLSFLTANRYSLIFNLKVVLVRRYYPNDPIKTRVMRELYMIIVALPFLIAYTVFMEKCVDDKETEELEPEPIDHVSPSVPESGTIARPHAHL